MDFKKTQLYAHEMSRAKGFYEDDELLANPGLLAHEREILRVRLILTRMAMIGSEVGEAVDAVRSQKVNTTAFQITSIDGALEGTVYGSELADIVIRTMDLSEYMGIDLEAEIKAKMAYNLTRPHKHGKQV